MPSNFPVNLTPIKAQLITHTHTYPKCIFCQGRVLWYGTCTWRKDHLKPWDIPNLDPQSAKMLVQPSKTGISPHGSFCRGELKANDDKWLLFKGVGYLEHFLLDRRCLSAWGSVATHLYLRLSRRITLSNSVTKFVPHDVLDERACLPHILHHNSSLINLPIDLLRSPSILRLEVFSPTHHPLYAATSDKLGSGYSRFRLGTLHLNMILIT